MFYKDNFAIQGLLEDTEAGKKSLEEEIQKTTEVNTKFMMSSWCMMLVLLISTRFPSRYAVHKYTSIPLLFQNSKTTVEDDETLKSMLQEAEAVQMQANSAEQDYEEVIRLLEAEIKDLKEQLAEKKHTSLQVTNVSEMPKVI